MRLDEEKEIVILCKTDHEAFSHLYELNYGPLLNYAIRRTGNVDVAKDIVAETFCKAVKNIQNYQWRNIPFSAWLYRIANNEVNQFFRDSRYKAVSLEEMIEQNGIEPRSEFDLEEVILAQEELEVKHKQWGINLDKGQKEQVWDGFRTVLQGKYEWFFKLIYYCITLLLLTGS